MDSIIIYSFFLYFFFITFPLIPAILIYKLFPDTKVGAKGFLGKLKINATGAFAAYMITLILSTFVVQYVQGMILGRSEQIWTIEAKLKFLDENNRPFQGDLDGLVNQTEIATQPEIFESKNADKILMRLACPGRKMTIKFRYADKFLEKTYDLSSNDTNLRDVKIDETRRRINLGTVYLKQIKRYRDTTGGILPTHVGPIY